MKSRAIFTTILSGLFLLSISACITIKVGEKEKTAEPTSSPKVEPTAVVIQPTAAQAAQPAPAALQLALSTELYTAEPAGFAFKIPQGWTQALNTPLFGAYTAPDGSGSYYVRAYHTGAELDIQSFNNAVQNVLTLLYANVTDYKELSRQEEEGRMLMLRSSFTGGDGKKRVSMDIFDRRGLVM